MVYLRSFKYFILPCQTCAGQVVGDLRLVDSPDEYSGTLEVFMFDRWGRVCPSGWDARSTAVACRQLGFTGAVSAFTNVDEVMVNSTETSTFNAIQGINCNGSEIRLINCTRDTGGTNACNEVDYLGIVCTSESRLETSLSTYVNNVQYAYSQFQLYIKGLCSVNTKLFLYCIQ